MCAAELTGDTLDALASLVEKSLVRQSEGIDGDPRFRMLETIREYALEQAIERGRWAGLRERHAAYFVNMAEDAAADVMSSSKRATLDRLEQDHDNLRAALGWSIEAGAADTAMRLGAALWRFWQMRGYLPEGLERLELILAMEHSHDHPERRADALNAAAGVAYWLAATDRSRALYEEEIAARRALGDRRGLAEALYSISFTWLIIGLQDERNAASALRHVNEARAIFTELDDDGGIGRCEWALANIAFGAGRTDVVRRHTDVALAVFERADDRFMVGWASYTRALAEIMDALPSSGDHPEALLEARRWSLQALEIFAEAQDISGYTLVLDSLALVAFRLGDRERAARLSGAVAQLERTSGTGLNLWNRGVLEFYPEELERDPALAESWASGEAMSAAEAVAYARDV